MNRGKEIKGEDGGEEEIVIVMLVIQNYEGCGKEEVKDE